MICSMTAYARCETNGIWGKATWELRSVNQRYLEISCRLPEQFYCIEPIVRERVRARIRRGKIECNLRFEPDIGTKEMLIINEKLLKQLVNAAKLVKMQIDEGEINLVDILYWPGVITVQQKQDADVINTDILNGFDSAMDSFIIARMNEGKTLKILIEKRLQAIIREIEKIRVHMAEILQWQRNRLVKKLEDAKINLNIEDNRFEQELILMAQRFDINEEIDRLETHVKETYNILNKRREAIGRRLDFMMQEFNRESNTLASKSINIEVTNSAIELKVLIEQIREQIQNVE